MKEKCCTKDGQERVERTLKFPIWRSCRVLLAIIGFLGTMNLYALRMNTSVAVICMTNHTAVKLLDSESKNVTDTNIYLNTTYRDTLETCQSNIITKSEDGELVWNKETRGLVLGVFFWGYLITQIPSGILVQKIGSKMIILLFTLLNGLVTLLFPIAAKTNVGFAMFLRILSGVASGVWFPCFHHLWSHWAPPLERSILVGITYAGLHIGNAVTLPFAGFLCRHGFAGGWPSIYYIFGTFSILWCILWYFFVYDGPTKHPRISISEKKLIIDSLKGQVHDTDTTVSIPLVKFLTSPPVWAIIVVNVCFDWNGYLFLTSIPTYMKDVLKFNILQSSGWASLPYIGFWVGQVVAACVSDILIKKKLLSTTWTRKLMNSIGMLGPAVLILILGYLTCENRYAAVAILTLGLMLKSAVFVGCFVNHVDIAPKYAGILFAISNTIAALTGFFAPYMVGAITKNNSQAEWQIVFFISAAIYVFGGVIFLIFASGELQPWARDDDKRLRNTGDEIAIIDNPNHHCLEEQQPLKRNEKQNELAA